MKDPAGWIGGFGGWPDYERPDHCPACGARFDAMANTTDLDPPSPGARALCIFCQSINVVGDDGKLRLPTDSEAFEHAHDPDIQAILTAMRMLGPPPSRRRP